MYLDVPGPAGVLEALLDEPRAPSPVDSALASAASPRAAVVFAHPHPEEGGTMHTKAVFQGAKGLARIGCSVLRFNFRGVGKSAGTFDAGKGEAEDFRAAIDFMAARYPGVPLWVAGFSFGSWIALETGAVDPRVSLLIGIAPPVTRPHYDFTHTLASTKPKFFIQGDLDELCPTEGSLGVLREAPGAEGARGHRRRLASVRREDARSRRGDRRLAREISTERYGGT